MEHNLCGEKISGIYMIQNQINGKIYIGQSVNIYYRWYMHEWHAEHNFKSSSYLYKSIRYYGIDNFNFFIIKKCNDLDYWEKFYIKLFHSDDYEFGYNLTEGGQLVKWEYYNNKIKNGEVPHPMTGHIWTEKQRQNMSKGRKGKFCGEDHYFSKMTKEEKNIFIKEKMGSFTSYWWNNGEKQVRAFECPGEGWKRGMCKNSNGKSIKGLKFWNNGIICIRAKTCPEGFVKGRLPFKN